MSKSIEQQAVETLYSCFTWAQGAEALSRAGLLVSERDVLCRKLADALGVFLGKFPNGAASIARPEWKDVLCAHSAIAAYDREHAPKPRYVVDGKYVIDTGGGNRLVIGLGTPEQNATMCAALNALAEKEAGR